jgi:peptidyl-prolyl cis-trans isomerase A (cyclophilin A)
MKTGILSILLACGLFFTTSAQTEVTFYTSMGNFKVALTDELTPVTVDSFIARVTEKFYDGLTFHRVIDGFMIQGGDPTGDGTGGPGYTIPDEFHPTLKNVPKALAMANKGPNTGGCQFFINLVTNSHLNNKHTVFGMVTADFPVVQNIGKVATDGNDKPITPVVIDSIRVTQFPASVKKLSGNINTAIYPNPASGQFTIDLPHAETLVEIVNLQGQVVYTAHAKNKLHVQSKNLAPGLYVVRVSNRTGMAELKLIIQ